jgi:acyl-ACP thioesterase
MSASIEVINSLEKLVSAVKDIRTAILKPSKSRHVKEAEEILTSNLRCGFLKLSDITKMKLMYEQGFTEQESIEIIAYLHNLEF